MTLEIEIKFRIPDSKLAGDILEDAFLMEFAPSKEWRSLMMEAVYYDTPDLVLQKAGIVYRVRREGDRKTATVKTGGKGDSHLQKRQEWNIEVSSLFPDVEVLFNSGAGSKLKKVLGNQKEIIALFSCCFDRQFLLTSLDRDTWVEIAMDRGEIKAGSKREAICELELELKSGSLHVMERAASVLAERYRLVPEPRSKFSRGLALFSSLQANGEGR